MTKSAIKKKTWLIVAHARLYIARRPRLKKIVAIVFARYPDLARRIVQGANAAVTITPVDHFNGSHELAYPSLRANRIYADLKTAIMQRNQRSI